jgi:hypothetical protein
LLFVGVKSRWVTGILITDAQSSVIFLHNISVE